MSKVDHPSTPTDSGAAETREILVPFDEHAGPVTAVRNVLIQASLTELKAAGHYEQYSTLIEPRVLEELHASFGPGWVPVELALAHYAACERLKLSRDEFANMGGRVGDRVQDATLVSTAKRARTAEVDVWACVGPLSRMWPRLFQGGTVQMVKAGPREMVQEERGFLLNRFHYYRQGHQAAVLSTFTALGVKGVTTKIAGYNPTRDELIVRISWR